jgi:hypothetical protein
MQYEINPEMEAEIKACTYPVNKIVEHCSTQRVE